MLIGCCGAAVLFLLLGQHYDEESGNVVSAHLAAARHHFALEGRCPHCCCPHCCCTGSCSPLLCQIIEPDNSPMPCNDAGRTYIHIAGALYFTIICEMVMWGFLIKLYLDMHINTKFDMHKANKIYSGSSDLFDMEKHVEPFMEIVVPYMDSIQELKQFFDAYFYLCGVTTVLFIFRMFEYLDFQGKLNAITQTFKVGVGELAHLLLVLNVAVTGFSFLGYILFGAQVKAFRNFSTAFISIWEMCFGLFKLKPIQIKYYNPAAGYMYEFMFKMLITMLLLKMVVAIIFDAYKSTAIKTRKTAPTVPDAQAVVPYPELDCGRRWVCGAGPNLQVHAQLCSPDDAR